MSEEQVTLQGPVSAPAPAARDDAGRFAGRQSENDPLRDDLPSKEWLRVREDQLSGRAEERDAQVKAFADAILPAVRQEIRQSQTIQQQPERKAGENTEATKEQQQEGFHPDAVSMQQAVSSAWGINPDDTKSYAEKMKTAMTEFSKREDATELLEKAKDVTAANHVQRALIETGNPAVYLYLIENPLEALPLNRMNPTKVAAALAKIEASLSDGPRETRAPRPVTPVNRPRAVNSDLSDTEPYPDWLRKREAQVRSR